MGELYWQLAHLDDGLHDPSVLSERLHLLTEAGPVLVTMVHDLVKLSLINAVISFIIS
jgi:hypothetical protein